ncbi:Carbamoyl-phosphate synthase, partial [Coemansia linderi]
RFCNAPRRIFGLPEQPDTYVEIHRDRLVRIPPKSDDAKWFPNILAKPAHCAVHRVVMRGKTLLLDGMFYDQGLAPVGRDLCHVLRTMSSGPSGKQFAQPPAMAAGALSVKTTEARPALHARKSSLAMSPAVVPAIEVDTIDEVDAVSASLVDVQPPAVDETALATRIERPLPESRLADVMARHGNQNPFYMKHVLSVRQFTREDLHLLFAVAQEMRTVVQRSGTLPLLTGRVMAAVFYEPSSRTSSSFQTAMLRLGGQVFTANSESSSVAKGETLEDTVRTFGSYADIITLRHPQPGSVQGAARFANIPVLNAGDGIGEHPSQAMLDT